jgi:hypothetical protein
LLPPKFIRSNVMDQINTTQGAYKGLPKHLRRVFGINFYLHNNFQETKA